MDDFLQCVLMAGITLPVAFLVARGYLHGVIRVVERRDKRHVLSSRP